MFNWSDKLLNRVEAALDHSGWLVKMTDAVLTQFLPHDKAYAWCTQCGCDNCSTWQGKWCWFGPSVGCVRVGGPCSPPGPC